MPEINTLLPLERLTLIIRHFHGACVPTVFAQPNCFICVYVYCEYPANRRKDSTEASVSQFQHSVENCMICDKPKRAVSQLDT
jgi:hypothetical protein